MSLQIATRGGRGARSEAAPRWLVGALLVAFVLFGIGPQVGLALGSLLVLGAIVVLCWRAGDARLIILFVFLMQWIESSAGIFYSNLFNVSIDDGSLSGDVRQFATTLLLISLLIQAIGFRWVVGKDPRLAVPLAQQLSGLSQRQLVYFYLTTAVLSIVAENLARLIPPLSQPLLVLVYFKWAAFVILTWWMFANKRANLMLWFAIFVFELLISLGHYFSSFKFVFIFTFLGIALSDFRARAYVKVVLVGIAASAVLLGAVWSYVKVDYRLFVSRGEAAQVVAVGYIERTSKLVELTNEMTMSDLANGLDILVKRLEYAEYFGNVTTKVPEFIPYAMGERWFDAVSRPLMPRLFFPGKAIIDESELSRVYTGRAMAGMEEGTQISIGYIGESYIDFGPYGMMLSMLAWGMFLGWVYRWLVFGRASGGLLGIGLVTAIFVMTASSVGNSLAKLVGGLVVCIPVIWLFVRFVVPRVYAFIQTRR